MRKRLPSALAVPKCFRANAVLTMATGSFESRSSSLNVRPSTIRCPVTSKNVLEICSKFAFNRSRRSRYTLPSISTGPDPLKTIRSRLE